MNSKSRLTISNVNLYLLNYKMFLKWRKGCNHENGMVAIYGKGKSLNSELSYSKR